MTRSVWRIGTKKALTLNDLSFGSTLSSGRWHLKPPDGLPVVYAGSSRAICQLEKRVHCNGVAPINLVMLRLDLPDGALLQHVQDVGELPPDWIDQQAMTRDLGVRWRKDGTGLGLWVPSAVEPSEMNLLINPDHQGYGAITLEVERDPFRFDPRVFG